MTNFNIHNITGNLVLLLGGDVPLDSDIKSMVKNSLYCICADSGAGIAYDCGRIPDYLVGDMDSVNAEVMNWCIANGVKSEKYCPEKDFTDGEIALDLAIKTAKEKSIKQITVIGAYGNRLDHTLANLFIGQNALKQGLDIVYINDGAVIYLLSEESSVSIYAANGKTVSLLPVTEKVLGVTLKGFKYSLNNSEMFNCRAYGISNEITAEVGCVSLKKGCLMIIQNRAKV